MKEIRNFIVLTFCTTWILWGSLVALSQLNILRYGTPLFMTIFVLGAFAPALSAIWLTKRNSEKKKYHAFLKNIINPKHHLLWYVFIIIVVLILSIVRRIVPYGVGDGIIKQPVYFTILYLPMMVIGGGLEEIGWRGFLQPRLEKLHSPLLSTMSIGVIWTIWHIPLWFIVGANQVNFNLISYFFNVLAFAFVLAVVYSGTKSIFMCILCHALINSCLEVFPFNNNILSSLAVLLVGFVTFIVCQYLVKKSTKKAEIYH